MAHFYGTCQGGRGQASRLGTKKSGMTTECNSWSIGATCRLDVANTDGMEFDELTVQFTRGSNSSGDLCRVDARMENGELVLQPDEFFLACVKPQHIGARLKALDDPGMIEWVGSLILQNPKWAKYLRTQLWLTGQNVEPDDADA